MHTHACTAHISTDTQKLWILKISPIYKHADKLIICAYIYSFISKMFCAWFTKLLFLSHMSWTTFYFILHLEIIVIDIYGESTSIPILGNHFIQSLKCLYSVGQIAIIISKYSDSRKREIN